MCDEIAIMNVYGQNVCESHAGSVILERRVVQKPKEKEDELTLVAKSVVETSNNLREAFQRALRELKEKYPENEVMSRVQELWLRERT